MTNETVFQQLIATHPALAALSSPLAAAHEMLYETYRQGGKVLVAGNGGSAADAQHIVGELMKGFVKKRPLTDGEKAQLLRADAARGARLGESLQRGLPALSLAGETALFTAFANDCDPALAMAQQVFALGREGDTLWLLSTSGNAENLQYAAAAAHARGMKVLLFSGEDGGALRHMADACVLVPARATYLVQEYHLPLYHALCMMLENDFFEA